MPILPVMFPAEPEASSALRRDADDPELRKVFEETQAHSRGKSGPAPDGSNTSSSTATQGLLREAAFCIGHITGAGPKVMITVAMAIRMGKPLLLQSQDRSNDLPFVLRSHRVVIDRMMWTL